MHILRKLFDVVMKDDATPGMNYMLVSREQGKHTREHFYLDARTVPGETEVSREAGRRSSRRRIL